MRRLLALLLWSVPLTAQAPITHPIWSDEYKMWLKPPCNLPHTGECEGVASVVLDAPQNANLPAQVVQITAKNTPSLAVTPKAASDTFVVECDYGTTGVVPSIADTAGLTYSPVGLANTSTNLEQFLFISAPIASTAVDTLTCPQGKNFGEIYVVEITGAVIPDGATQSTAASGPATGTVTTTPGDVVLAFCITGTCSNAAGWSALTNYDDNLVAEATSVTGTSLSASFPTTQNYVLTLIALKTAPPPPPPTINIGLAGSITLVGGAPAVPLAVSVLCNQWNGTAWTSLGNATLSSTGVLAGLLQINPAYADSKGNIAFQFCVSGIPDCYASTFPLAEFQQGSSGITVNLTLFSLAAPYIKTASFGLTP
jgi:hypothetical protein